MKKTNGSTTRPEAREDITVLGVASLETLGKATEPDEPMGFPGGSGISDD